MPAKSFDLIGMTFGELEVRSCYGSIDKWGRKEKYWLCNCSCGKKEVMATTRELRKGRKKSCGHTLKSKRKDNHKYLTLEGYTVVFTHKGEPFYIDSDDLENVLKRTWWKHNSGYIVCKLNNSMKQLHRYILNPPEDKEVDHINHVKHDNRKGNLRVCDHLQNSWNIDVQINNTSGVTGVCVDNKYGKWNAYIRVDGERINLGSYTNKEDAIVKRKEAEIKYYGEFQRKEEEELPLPLINDNDFIFEQCFVDLV